MYFLMPGDPGGIVYACGMVLKMVQKMVLLRSQTSFFDIFGSVRKIR
jgi:hypothetical protein